MTLKKGQRYTVSTRSHSLNEMDGEEMTDYCEDCIQHWKQEGKTEAYLCSAKKLIEMGMTDSFIAEATELSKEEIQKLRQKDSEKES